MGSTRSNRNRVFHVLLVVALIVVPAVPALAGPPAASLQVDGGSTELHEPHRGVYECPDGGDWHFVLNQVSPSNSNPGTITVEFSTGEVVQESDKVLRTVRHFNIEGAGTLITASVDIGGAKLVLSDYECGDTPPPPPGSCAEADIKVYFDGTLGDPSRANLFEESITTAANVPAGTYYVVVESADSTSRTPFQYNEQWRVVFNTSPQTTTDYTPDLPEDVTSKTYDLGQITLPTAATEITAEHIKFGDDTPWSQAESVEPVCVGLTPTG